MVGMGERQSAGSCLLTYVRIGKVKHRITAHRDCPSSLFSESTIKEDSLSCLGRVCFLKNYFAALRECSERI